MRFLLISVFSLPAWILAGLLVPTASLFSQTVIMAEPQAEEDEVTEFTVSEPDSAPVDSDTDRVLVRVEPAGSISAQNTPAIHGRGLSWRVENNGELTQSGSSPAVVLLSDGTLTNQGEGRIAANPVDDVAVQADGEKFLFSGAQVDSWTDDATNAGEITVTASSDHLLTLEGIGSTADIAAIRFGDVPRVLPEDPAENENGENGDSPDEPEEVAVPNNFRNTGSASVQWSGTVEAIGTDNQVRVSGVHFEDHGELRNEGEIEAVFDGEIDGIGSGNSVDVAGVRGDEPTTIENTANGVIRSVVDATGESAEGATAAGISVRGGEGNVSNRGTIEVSGSAERMEGIVFDDGGEVQNRATGTISVTNDNADGTATGITIRLVDSEDRIEDARIINSGRILVPEGVAVNLANGGFLHNTGRIEGDVTLGDGDAILRITPTQEISGSVDAGGGHNILELAGSGEGTYDGAFDGFDELHIRGEVPISGIRPPAFWRLTGDQHYAGGTEVFQGFLSIEDSLTSDMVIHADGRVYSAGTLTGNVTSGGELGAGIIDEEGFFVAPEEGDGILSIDGNITFQPGSKLRVISGRTRLHATGNAVILEPDPSDETDENGEQDPARLVLFNQFVEVGGEYQILQADGSLTGEFEFMQDDERPFVTLVIEQDGNSIIGHGSVEREAIAAAGNTRNQREVARALAEFRPAQGSEGQERFHELLENANVFNFPLLADRLSGEVIASGAIASAAYGKSFQQNLLNTVQQGPARDRGVRYGGWNDYAGIRLAGPIPRTQHEPEPRPTRALWGRGFGGTGKVESDHLDGRLDYGMGGVMVGADTVMTERVRAGGAVGLARGKLDRGSDEIESDVYQLAAYGSGRIGDFSLDGAVGYGFHDLESSRRPDSGGERTRGSYNGHEFFATAQVNTVRDLDDLFVMPFGGLTYSHFRQDGFRESGPWALDVSSANINSLRAFAGLRAAMAFQTGNRNMIVPEMRAGYSHELLDDEASFSAGFRGDTQSHRFVTTSTAMDRGQFQAGAGLMVQLARYENLSMFVDYDATLSDSRTEHLFSGGFRLAF